jgi:hypothetical protein
VNDPVTSALTGHLTFQLLVAAALTWPGSMIALHLYSRAVRRSMSAGNAQPQATTNPPAKTTVPDERPLAPAVADLHDLPPRSAGAAAGHLVEELFARPKRAAVVYAVAGCAYAIVMATAMLVSAGLEILPVRFLFFFWVFAWPIVPTIGIVGPTGGRSRIALVAAYVLGLVAIGAVGTSISPDLTWPQVFLPWLVTDLPPTLLLLTYLSRRIRAVGPLILTFFVFALIGSDVVATVLTSNERSLRVVVDLATAIGLDTSQTLLAIFGAGFVMFGVVGGVALVWIRRWYQAKATSDESLTVDAIWLLFATAHAMDLVFEHPLWMLSGVVALAAYKACVLSGFALQGHVDRPAGQGPTLLVLRSFAIGKDSERLFDIVERHWRRVGSIQMIAGVDFANHTVEPHEFLDFLSGTLSRRFIDGGEALARRLGERDLSPDRDRRYRVNEFFCHDDTWRTVLSRLVDSSDVVLMDLRGFSSRNIGCIFELRVLAELVSLDRVVFVVDERTDERLFAETLAGCRAGVLRLGTTGARDTAPLMRALAAAATTPTGLVIKGGLASPAATFPL